MQRCAGGEDVIDKQKALPCHIRAPVPRNVKRPRHICAPLRNGESGLRWREPRAENRCLHDRLSGHESNAPRDIFALVVVPLAKLRAMEWNRNDGITPGRPAREDQSSQPLPQLLADARHPSVLQMMNEDPESAFLLEIPEDGQVCNRSSPSQACPRQPIDGIGLSHERDRRQTRLADSPAAGVTPPPAGDANGRKGEFGERREKLLNGGARSLRRGGKGGGQDDTGS